MTEALAKYNADAVRDRIFTVRGQKIILDSDLAAIYGVATKVLNQAVKRNADKFPDDFMFRLTKAEAEDMRCSRSQSVTLKRGQNIKYLPHARPPPPPRNPLSARPPKIQRFHVGTSALINLIQNSFTGICLAMSKPLKAKQKSSEQNPLGSWFRKLRQARGLPLRVIAPATDMNTAQLSKVELAKRLPTEKQKDVLTWYFGVPLEEMEVKSISNRFCTEKRDNPAASNDPSIIGKQRSTDTKGQHRNT